MSIFLTSKYFFSEISSAKRSFASAKAIFVSREALKSPAWSCDNFTRKYFAVLNFCFFCFKTKENQEYPLIKFLYEINRNQWLKLIKA